MTGQAGDFKEALRRAYDGVKQIRFDPPGASSNAAVIAGGMKLMMQGQIGGGHIVLT